MHADPREPGKVMDSGNMRSSSFTGIVNFHRHPGR